MSNFVALYLSVYVISTWTYVVTGDCKKINSCSCKNSDGTYIDLSPLAKSGGEPQFLDVPDQQGLDTYSWNPCSDFSEGSCSGVAVCQVRQAIPNPLYFNCGTQDSANFLTNEKGELTLQYSANTEGTLRTTNVVLKCDQSAEKDLIIKGEEGSMSIYDMILTSKFACSRSGPAGSGSGSLSAGWILVIIFISVLALYLIIGVAIQVGVRKKRGIESLPNSEFWTGLPSHIKAGVMFTVQRGRGQKYDAI